MKNFLLYFGRPYTLSGYLPHRECFTLKEKGIDKTLLEKKKQNKRLSETYDVRVFH